MNKNHHIISHKLNFMINLIKKIKFSIKKFLLTKFEINIQKIYLKNKIFFPLERYFKRINCQNINIMKNIKIMK